MWENAEGCGPSSKQINAHDIYIEKTPLLWLLDVSLRLFISIDLYCLTLLNESKNRTSVCNIHEDLRLSPDTNIQLNISLCLSPFFLFFAMLSCCFNDLSESRQRCPQLLNYQ